MPVPSFTPEPNPNAGFYAALKNELADARYAGLTHQQMADSLNAMVEQAPRLVPYAEFQPFMMQQVCWVKIRLAALQLDPHIPAQQGLLGLCLVAIDLLTHYIGATVDTSLATFHSVLAGLVSGGLVTSQEQAAILALGNLQTSRALLVLGKAVTVHDIDVAEAL